MWMAYSVLRSSMNRRSGIRRRERICAASSCRTYPRACSSAAIASPLSASSPSALTWTLALRRSGERSTPITLIRPTRGSPRRRPRIALISSRSCAATLSTRTDISTSDPYSAGLGVFLLEYEGLDRVPLLEVLEAFQLDTAFETLGNLADVVLEALEARDLGLDQQVLAPEDLGHRVAGDLALADLGAGDEADLC